MRILAFDPGHTTGIAFVNGGVVEMVTTINHAYVVYPYTFLLCEHLLPDVVAIETAPNGRLADPITTQLITSLESYAKQYGIRVCRISPGLWKPVSPKPDKSWAIHGADAVGLALYAERVHKG